MKVELSDTFLNKLAGQVEYIALDKPFAARKFKNDIISLINDLTTMPYKHRKSIYFNRNDIREVIFKGYKIVYKIDDSENRLIVFGLIKEEKNLF